MHHLKLKPEPLTAEEYLEGEERSPLKHELIEGEAYAMAGTSWRHNLLCGNLFRQIGNHLEATKSPCLPFIADMKLKVATNFYYPDLFVSCTRSDHPSVQESAVLVVEVLSKSTRKLDKSRKQQDYLHRLPMLQEYLLIEQDCVDIEILRRSHGWQSQHYFLGDPFTLESIGLTTTVEAVYRQLDLEEIAAWQAS